MNQNPTAPSTTPSTSSVVETNAIPLEQLTEVNKFQKMFLSLDSFVLFSRLVQLR
jgi:hypothetical protein